MHRALYLAGFGYLAICGMIVLRHTTPHSADAWPTPAAGDPAAAWFTSIKPQCNAVEVKLAQEARPAPATLEGQGYSAAKVAGAGLASCANFTSTALHRSEEHTSEL